MPVPQMAESLSKGVIDGALVPWEVVPATKTHELVKFHAEASGKNALTTATMVLLMNQAKYDALPANLKKVIDENRGRDTSAWVSSEFDKAGAAGVAAATGRGNAIYKIPETEMVKWQKAAKSVDDAWVKEVNGLGKDGKALLQEAKSLIAKYTK
jgi:TRAP-type C4-dicarboxylate transport system substrate-binding protein